VSQEAWDAGEYDILEPAEQPASAADAPVPKFDAALKSAKDFLSSVGQHRAGRLVTEGPRTYEAEPTAPAQGAPAEPLSERMHEFGEGMDSVQGDAVRGFADEVATLEARLAAAERSVDRHRLVLDEERRCYGILKAKLAAAETEKETLSTHCVRAERIAQERKEALAAAERDNKLLSAAHQDAVRGWDDARQNSHAGLLGLRMVYDALKTARSEWVQFALEVVDVALAAERERDEAVKDAGDWAARAALARSEERGRCIIHFRSYMAGGCDMYSALDAIRDGRPAPK